MTAEILRRFEADTGEFFEDVGEVLAPASLTGSPLPGFLLFLGALFTALATFVVWLELIMREAAIYVAVAFLPLCFAAMVWERTAHWCRRLVELPGRDHPGEVHDRGGDRARRRRHGPRPRRRRRSRRRCSPAPP